MPYNVIIKQEAHNDVQEAYEYYEKKFVMLTLFFEFIVSQ